MSKDIASEPAALTYGMSKELRDSDLLWRISSLDRNDQRCLIKYILHEMEEDIKEDDWEEQAQLIDIGPNSIEEARERADAAMKRYKRGEVLTATEAKAKLLEELPWLR